MSGRASKWVARFFLGPEWVTGPGKVCKGAFYCNFNDFITLLAGSIS